MDIADTIMGKPIGFKIGNRHFCLYPPSLGKLYLIKRLIKQLDINMQALNANMFLLVLKLCKDKRGIVCKIIAYHSLCKKQDLFNENKVLSRQSLFSEKLDDDELAQLLIITASWYNADLYIRHLGLQKEQDLRRKIYELKSKGNGIVSFGGTSVYGKLIDVACHRYGWTIDYVVWGISYINLQMIIADAMTSVCLSSDEIKKLHISTDGIYISGDDPANMEEIKNMCWS